MADPGVLGVISVFGCALQIFYAIFVPASETTATDTATATAAISAFFAKGGNAWDHFLIN